MDYFLSSEVMLKWLETPSVYNIRNDELYELDTESFEFLKKCSSSGGYFSEADKFIEYCLNEGILVLDRTLSRRPPVIKSPVPSLRYLELQITDQCNLSCGHCYISEKSSAELSPGQVRNIMEEFEELQGLRVLITGGEPLLHSSFPEINDMLRNYCVRKILFTNGLLLDEEVLSGLNVDEIQISIDGLETAHDLLRGKGVFKKAMDAVVRSLETGFEVSVSTMVHSGNLGDFDEMETMFKKLRIKDWTIDIPCVTGRLQRNVEFQVSPDEGGKFLKYGFGEGVHGSEPGFACGLHLASVMADGRVSKCTFYADQPLGVIEEGLRECRRRLRPVRLEELKCDCGHIEICRGGCRYRAGLFGDAMGKDIYRCAFFL